MLDLHVSILIDWILWSFDQNRSDPKVILSEAKKNMLIAKSLSEFFPERFTFGPESGRIKETVWELVKKYEIMETHQMMTEAKAGDMILSFLIINLLIVRFCLLIVEYQVIKISHPFQTFILSIIKDYDWLHKVLLLYLDNYHSFNETYSD